MHSCELFEYLYPWSYLSPAAEVSGLTQLTNTGKFTTIWDVRRIGCYWTFLRGRALPCIPEEAGFANQSFRKCCIIIVGFKIRIRLLWHIDVVNSRWKVNTTAAREIRIFQEIRSWKRKKLETICLCLVRVRFTLALITFHIFCTRSRNAQVNVSASGIRPFVCTSAICITLVCLLMAWGRPRCKTRRTVLLQRDIQ